MYRNFIHFQKRQEKTLINFFFSISLNVQFKFADIIVKDNDREERVTVDNLLDIDKARILQCKTMQVRSKLLYLQIYLHSNTYMHK